MRYFIEQALLESLEDEMDLEAYHARQNEETIPLETLLAKRKKKNITFNHRKEVYR